MACCPPVMRRLLLAQLGSGIFGTFLLPDAQHRAMAATPTRTAATVQPAGRAAPGGSTRPSARQPPLVMLDPGHGGKDPGAIGISGTYEKQVSLATALELKR